MQSTVVPPIQIAGKVCVLDANIDLDAVDAQTNRGMIEQLIIDTCSLELFITYSHRPHPCFESSK